MRKTIGRGFKFLALVCLLLALAACSNLSNKEEQKSGIIRGSVSLPGQARSAFPADPDFATLDLVIEVYNEAGTIADNVTINIATDKKSYSVEDLAFDTNYKIKAVLKSEFNVLYESEVTDFIEITEENPVIDENLILVPLTGGYGTISLDVTVDSDTGIQSANIKGQLNSAAKSGNTYTFENTNVSSGAYEMTFCFYSRAGGTGELLYSFTEAVNVFTNLTTNGWVNNGGSPYLETTTAAGGNTSIICHITKELVDNFRIKNIYVDPSATTTSETGTRLNPCRTLNAAIQRLTDAGTDYTILINGTLTGAQTIPASLSKNGADTTKSNYAKSLTICGANGLDDSGEPQDALKGSNEDVDTHNKMCVLTVNTDVPVHLKNIKITKGCGDEDLYAGGLTVSSSSEVWIESGAFITENYAFDAPAGVLNFGTCHLTGGKIKGNTGNDDVDSRCGGIYNQGTFVMTDGEISNNSATVSNGILCSNTCTTELSGGTISNGGTSISVGAGGNIKMGGNINIATNDQIFLGVDDTNCGKILITTSLTGSTPIATIEPGSYTSNLQLVDIAEGSNVTLANEAVKFAVKSQFSQPNTPWKLNLEGKLVPWIGLKGPTETKSVGDIVFNDGSAIAYNSNLTLDSTQKSSAIAVIFVKRNGNFYGIGLKEAGGSPSCKIAYDGTNGVSTSVGASDTNDGKSNTQKFKDLSDYSQNNYPAIWWAYNYSSKAGNLGTTYNSDWYVPASGELTSIYNQMTTINGAFGKIGNSAVQLTKTREYVSSTEKDASNCICNTMNGSTKQVRKNSNAYFRFVRQF